MTEPRTMRCEDALRLLALHLDRELGEREMADVEHHLSTCRSCYSRAEFERRLKAEFAALRSSDVPPELEARIRRLVSERTS